MKSLLILLSLVASFSASASGPFIKSFPIKVNDYSDKKADLGLKISLICSKEKSTLLGFGGGRPTYFKSCGTKDVIVYMNNKQIINSPAFEKLNSSSLKNYKILVSMVRKLNDGTVLDISERHVINGNELTPYSQYYFSQASELGVGLEYSIYSSPSFTLNSQKDKHMLRWVLSAQDGNDEVLTATNVDVTGKKFDASYMLIPGNPGDNPRLSITLADLSPWSITFEEQLDYKDFSLTLDQVKN